MPQSRKRNAPGSMAINPASPQPIQYPYQPTAPMGTQAVDWSYTSNDNGVAAALSGLAGYNFSPYPQQQLVPSETSTQLARRPTGNRTAADLGGGSIENWPARPVQSFQAPQRHEAWVEDLGELKERAAAIKRESQSGRKAIPPFIRKLRSFVDNPENAQIIRWSSDGESFVVIDEDAFAKTLIPDLFKHNNYASFVRQLNMYGFHKRVGLGDNSMRASEKKTKTPSEYQNPFFKRDDPELMWLIVKPKSPPKSKKRNAVDQDDDADDVYDAESPTHQTHGEEDKGALSRGHRPPLLMAQEETPAVSSISKEQEVALKETLARIQRNQQALAESVRQLQIERDQKAVAYQEMHKKHENSINAILTFLATIYNRSLEGANGQHLADMFKAPLTRDAPHQGNVVEVDNFEPTSTPSSAQVQQRVRRPLLLQAPPSNENSSGSPVTVSTPPTAASSPEFRSTNLKPVQGSENHYSSNGHTPTTAPSPAQESLGYHSEAATPGDTGTATTPFDQVMSSYLNSVNNGGSFPNARMDFSQAFPQLDTSSGNSSLTPAQQSNALQSITNASKHMSGYPSANDEDLKALGRSLQEQSSEIADVYRSLSPLSPSGSIPGLDDQQYMGAPGDHDILGNLDHVFTDQDYFGDTTAADPASAFDFTNSNLDFTTAPPENFDFSNSPQFVGGNGFANNQFDLASQNGDGRTIETIPSSEATSPANTVDDLLENGGASPRKRLRRR